MRNEAIQWPGSAWSMLLAAYDTQYILFALILCTLLNSAPTNVRDHGLPGEVWPDDMSLAFIPYTEVVRTTLKDASVVLLHGTIEYPEDG